MRSDGCEGGRSFRSGQKEKAHAESRIGTQRQDVCTERDRKGTRRRKYSMLESTIIACTVISVPQRPSSMRRKGHFQPLLPQCRATFIFKLGSPGFFPVGNDEHRPSPSHKFLLLLLWFLGEPVSIGAALPTLCHTHQPSCHRLNGGYLHILGSAFHCQTGSS